MSTSMPSESLRVMKYKTKDKFYDSPKWLRLRASALRRDNYEDMEAKRYGIVKAAELVHHIFPRSEFPEYAYEMWNLISLSTSTHNTLHDRDSDELTEKGRQLLVRTARKNGIPVPEKYASPTEKKPIPFRKDWYQY